MGIFLVYAYFFINRILAVYTETKKNPSVRFFP